MPSNISDISGLSDAEVLAARKKYGSNRLEFKPENALLQAIKALATEPMVILLLITSTLYFINGNLSDGVFLACAIVLVATISLYQNSRSKIALDKLKNITQPACKVIRNGEQTEIHRDDLVLGDSLIVEEGTSIAADGVIIRSNDFSVNESILTGEAMPLYKDNTLPDRYIYQGTTVATGLAVATVTAIGTKTKLGLIGKSLEDIVVEKTPLECRSMIL
jgi:Ca2+-transporting ATPase